MQQPKNDNKNPSHSHTIIQEYANYLNSIPYSISNMGAETSQMILIITPKCYSYRCLLASTLVSYNSRVHSELLAHLCVFYVLMGDPRSRSRDKNSNASWFLEGSPRKHCWESEVVRREGKGAIAACDNKQGAVMGSWRSIPGASGGEY